ncbi:hypothetical protein NWP21_09800 [Anabaenopsis sp. FSS-46]|uniref:hypothetical protein n=1 Tax=Anabaenopsis sp. FSS-46 TaxID=2971766 RepID=UPI002473C7D7|nr:hypothetical protein [Anabaenopsis sp. FSS-46]MDH6099129.1 hypothetical protein [Anabaenopsis sp. FSS-46]
MKYQDLYLGVLSFGVCLTVASFATSAAFAQCVISHVGVQLNMSPTPARQTSNVQMYSPAACTGNTSSSTAVQVNTGNHGNVRQHQEVLHEIRGNAGNSTAVNGPTIKNSIVVPVNVKTPKNFSL